MAQGVGGEELPVLSVPEMLEACLSSPTAEEQRPTNIVNVVDGLFAIAHALQHLAVQVQGLNEIAARIEQQAKLKKVLLS
jgi:hypothetical protein